MARDALLVAQALGDATEALDNSLDVRKGPIRTLHLAMGGEISSAEGDLDHLRDLQLFERVDLWTVRELTGWGRKFGVSRGVGGFSRVRQIFQVFTRPQAGEIIEIPRGTLVGTSDGRKLYRVLQSVTIIGDFADNFFNASSRAFEVATTVEATAPGEDHDVPAGRINSVITPLDGVDGTTNRARSSGGRPGQDNEEFRVVVEAKLRGNSQGTGGGIRSSIFELDPDQVEDVIVVSSSDPLYRRLSETGTRAAFDVYLTGDILEDVSQTLTALGGETDIPLDNVPATSISAVRVDGSDVDFTFEPDTSDTLKLSARAADKIVLDVALVAAQELEIQHSFNRLIQDAQEIVDGRGSDLLETDILAREGIPIDCTIQVEVAIRSAFDTNAIKEEVDEGILSFFRNPELSTTTRQRLGGMFTPTQLKDFLIDEVSGIIQLTVTRFFRDDIGTLELDFIELENNEFVSTTPDTRIQ